MSPYYRSQITRREKKIAVKQWLLSSSFRVLFLVFVTFLGLLFVWQTSSASTKGYTINDLEKRVISLERENQKLEFAIAKNRSLQSIMERLPQTGLVVADDVNYAILVGASVALR